MIERKTVSQCISSDYCRGWCDAVDIINSQIFEVGKMIKDDLKFYLDTNEEMGVVYIPKFVIEKVLNKFEEIMKEGAE